MINYVNEDAFLAWYESKAKAPQIDRAALLNDVFRQYCETRREDYVLPAANARSGREERYPFRYENIGCCGASTVYIYFGTKENTI